MNAESVEADIAITTCLSGNDAEYAPIEPILIMFSTPKNENSSWLYMPIDGTPIPLAIIETGFPLYVPV